MAVTLDLSPFGLKPALRRAGKVVLYVLGSGFLYLIAQDTTFVHRISDLFSSVVSATGFVSKEAALVMGVSLVNGLVVLVKNWITSVKPTIILSQEEAPNA